MADALNLALLGRMAGPFGFRFLLQPAMAAILALRDGPRSALADEVPFLWSVLFNPHERRGRLIEGWRWVGKVAIIAVVLDLAYQIAVGQRVRLLDATLVALLLTVVPYALLRGLANRFHAAHLARRAGAKPSKGD